jgi:ATP-dependent DNA ligase
VQRALAEGAGVDAKRVAQRMMGYTDAKTTPSAGRFAQLTAEGDVARADIGQPYPFFLAHPLDLAHTGFAARLADPADWIVEWKYDGIRAQVIKRAGRVWIWSRGEELVTDRFPEIVALARPLPDGTVLDGEIVVWKDGRVASFALLQQRIGRKLLNKKVLADAPVVFIAYDILEEGGADVREQPQFERRRRLEALLATPPSGQPLPEGDAIRLSPVESAADWAALAELREQSRERGVEGFMLKHRLARYGTGRRKQDDIAAGTWWKWKIDPLSVDAVLVYAQAGHGRRASVYTDYTFAVWSRPPADAAEAQAAVDAIAERQPPTPDALQLVPFAKAYSGLTDEEFKVIDRVIGKPRSRSSGRCAASGRASSSSSASRASTAARGTRAASPCASRACCASATTSPCTRPTRCSRSRRCSPSTTGRPPTLRREPRPARRRLGDALQVALEDADVDQRRVGAVGPELLAAEAHVVGRLVGGRDRVRMRVGERIGRRFADHDAGPAADVTRHPHVARHEVAANADAVAGPEALAPVDVRAAGGARAGEREGAAGATLELVALTSPFSTSSVAGSSASARSSWPTGSDAAPCARWRGGTRPCEDAEPDREGVERVRAHLPFGVEGRGVRRVPDRSEALPAAEIVHAVHARS